MKLKFLHLLALQSRIHTSISTQLARVAHAWESVNINAARA